MATAAAVKDDVVVDPVKDVAAPVPDAFTDVTGRDFLKDMVADPENLAKLKPEKVIELATQWRERESKAPAWRGNWRESYSAGDAKKMERLTRYATPAAAFDALLGLQSKIGSGELKAVLPKDATPEQVTAWRKEAGIPETPEKYDLKLAKGVKVNDEDKPWIDGVLKSLHGANASNQVASAVVDVYYQEVARRAEERATKDAAFAQASEDTLRAEFGDQYRLNMNLTSGLLATAPADVRDLITHGRLSNGDPIMSHPGSLRWLVSLARQINPVSALVPGTDSASIGNAIEDEITAIEKDMKDKAGQYYKGPSVTVNGRTDTKMAHRYTELLGARERLGANKR